MHPGAPVSVNFAIVVFKKLRVKRREPPAGKTDLDDGLIVSVQFSPWPFGLLGVVTIDVAASLTIAEIQVVETIVALNDVWRLEVARVDGRQGGHDNAVVVPMLHVVAVPQRRCT